jgi:hypothetical protein
MSLETCLRLLKSGKLEVKDIPFSFVEKPGALTVPSNPEGLLRMADEIARTQVPETANAA